MELTVQRTSAERTRPLRRKILRPDQSPQATLYAADTAPAAYHVEALVNGEQAGVASLYPEARPEAPGGWRLRGMAVDAPYRGLGVGRALLAACLDHARAQRATEVWCNARSTAAGFYRRNGFEALGPEFELDGIGPHFVMAVRLGTAHRT